jgi:hypothetical protein
MDQDQQQRLNHAAEQFADALVEQLRTVSNRAVGVQEQGAQLTQNFFNRVVENLRTQAERNREMTQQLVDQQQRGAEAAQRLTQETVEAYTSLVNSMLSSSFQQGGTQFTQRAATEAVEEPPTVEEPPSVEVSAIEENEDTPMVEGDTTEALQGEEPSGEDIRSIIRESVSRSGAGSRQEVPQTESTTPEQSRRAGDEELPIEDYDSLNVKQISERLAELSDEEVEQLRRYEAANKNRSTLLRRLDERL